MPPFVPKEAIGAISSIFAYSKGNIQSELDHRDYEKLFFPLFHRSKLKNIVFDLVGGQFAQIEPSMLTTLYAIKTHCFEASCSLTAADLIYSPLIIRYS